MKPAGEKKAPVRSFGCTLGAILGLDDVGLVQSYLPNNRAAGNKMLAGVKGFTLKRGYGGDVE